MEDIFGDLYQRRHQPIITYKRPKHPWLLQRQVTDESDSSSVSPTSSPPSPTLDPQPQPDPIPTTLDIFDFPADQVPAEIEIRAIPSFQSPTPSAPAAIPTELDVFDFPVKQRHAKKTIHDSTSHPAAITVDSKSEKIRPVKKTKLQPRPGPPHLPATPALPKTSARKPLPLVSPNLPPPSSQPRQKLLSRMKSASGEECQNAWDRHFVSNDDDRLRLDREDHENEQLLEQILAAKPSTTKSATTNVLQGDLFGPDMDEATVIKALEAWVQSDDTLGLQDDDGDQMPILPIPERPRYQSDIPIHAPITYQRSKRPISLDQEMDNLLKVNDKSTQDLMHSVTLQV
ncbi:hypothetical protein DM01DRAFT_1333404 [Hesseltinella vesiculosa]|uniref:Uncharacterized protein n=1 Tax=Hesseltinella vesiculosa TaxID=101127 RepID=A0A1X2GQ31_9FUNG|nr:hypothetical protein DM01DRAFT_1333404 [Hesseltinella vesiculosa]